MDPAIFQSLQEIASLLLLIHDFYLKDATSNEVLTSLLNLLTDTRLCGEVSILEAERLRRLSMKTETHMGYDLFYEWLRNVSVSVFGDCASGGRKSLHLLLTEYIIPFATKLDPNNSTSGDYGKISDIGNVWKSTVEIGDGIVEIEWVMRSLEFYGIIPDLIGRDEVECLILMIANTSSMEHTTFPYFLYLIELIAGQMMEKGLSDRHYGSSSPVPGSEKITSHLLNIVFQVAQRMLENKMEQVVEMDCLSAAVKSFTAPSSAAAAAGGGGSDGSPMISTPYMLWWLRECGIVEQHNIHEVMENIVVFTEKVTCSHDALDSLDELSSNLLALNFDEKEGADDINKYNRNFVLSMWRANQGLIYMLYRIAEKYSVVSVNAILSATSGSGGSSQQSKAIFRHVVYIAQTFPKLLFANTVVSPAELLAMYSKDTLSVWRTTEDTLWRHVFATILGIARENASASSTPAASPAPSSPSSIFRCTHRELITYCNQAGLVPQVLSSNELLDLIDEIKPIVDERAAGSSSWCYRSHVVEVLYTVVCRYRDRIVQLLHSQEENCFRVLLQLVQWNPHAAISVLQPNVVAPVAQRENRFSAHATASATAADAKPQLRAGDAKSAEVVKKSSPEKPVVLQQQLLNYHAALKNHPLRDLVAVLMHYPLSSLDLNPWELVSLLSSISVHGKGFNLIQEVENVEGKADSPVVELIAAFATFYALDVVQVMRFTKKCLSPTLFKGAALPPNPLRFMLHERILRLLFLNADLLKFEFGRCFAKFRVSQDPFTEQQAIPLPTNESFAVTKDSGNSVVVSVSSLKLWAKHTVPQVSEPLMDEILLLLHNPLRVKGASGLVPNLGYVTYSGFMLFSFHCFTWDAQQVLLKSGTGGAAAAEAQLEEMFISGVRKMLQMFSQHLTFVQQKLHFRVLRPLYGTVEVAVDHATRESHVSDFLTVASASLGMFNDLQAGKKGPGFQSNPQLPPNPPLLLWDAPRFVCFCKQFNILPQISCSASSAAGNYCSLGLLWIAFGLYLKEINDSIFELWNANVVPPIPVKIDADCLQKLLTKYSIVQEMKRDAVTDVSSINTLQMNMSIYYKCITPMVCCLVDKKSLPLPSIAPSPGAQDNAVSLEDILRYGGSVALQELADLHEFLQLAYYSLQEQSQATLTNPLDAQGEDKGCCGYEILLNLMIRFFSCNDMLRISAIALQAKRSLFPRIRALYHSKVGASSAADVVTFSFPEFEELFIRCSFILWETSGAMQHAEYRPSFNSSNPQLVKMTATYTKECEAVREQEKAINARKGQQQKLSGWGVNFLRPYGRILQTFTEFTKSTLSSFQSKGGFGRPNIMTIYDELFHQLENAKSQRNSPTPRQRGKENADTSVINRSTLALDTDTAITKHLNYQGEVHRQLETDREILSDIIARGLSYSVADPAVRRTEESASQMALSDSDRSGNHSPASLSQGTTPAATATGKDKSKKHVFFSSPSAATSPQPVPHGGLPGKQLKNPDSGGKKESKLLTSQEVITSSSEKVQLMHESSEQFVVTLESLLAGAKEALWPIYATYCSCGDSMDPGKLSGPNLFTLLSKLGVLTDRNLLSDVGILLHQISSHAFTNVPIASVANLPTQLDSYESPSLTFEEFLVFLCAFSQLRYEGVLMTAALFNPGRSPDASGDFKLNPENWFRGWQKFMKTSVSFRRLLTECVLPILKNQTLLAFPEDARLRDRFCCVFSIEVLVAIEGIEGPLQMFFERESRNQKHDDELGISGLLLALKRINLMPHVINEAQVVQLLRDVMPDSKIKGKRGESSGPKTPMGKKDKLLFPQWEWVLCIVAFQAVEAAIQQSSTQTEPEKIPLLVADVVTSIASAMTNTPL